MKTAAQVTSLGFALALLIAALPLARAQDAADRLDMEAHAALNAENYDLAIKDWSELLKLHPDDSSALFNRATAWSSKGDKEKAIADFSAAIRLNPTDADSYAARGKVYGDLRNAAVSKGVADREDTGKEFADFAQMIRLRPDARSYTISADAYNEMHEYDKAIADYTEAIRLNPAASGYQHRGESYESKGDWDKAITDFTQLIQLGDNIGDAYESRAEVYLQKGDFDKALADANKGIRDSLWLGTYPIVLRGMAYAYKGEYGKALADYNQAMAAGPDDPDGYDAEARLYATCPKAEIRNGQKALELARKACELSKWENPYFIDTLAAAEAETGKWDDAIKHQKQAVEVAKAMRYDEWRIKNYASRIPLYEKKQPYREEKLPTP